MGKQPFSDRLSDRIQKCQSPLIAGIDPNIDDFPAFILKEASASAGTEQQIETALTKFHSIALDAIGDSVAAIKPNVAFFEQYGIGGMRAFSLIVKRAREASIPVIADAKRGDIGSTAKAYSNAYLGNSKAFGQEFHAFEADALTVNPFLGFDTLEVFLEDCERYGKGLFVLVRTSNSGSGDLQDREVGNSETISTLVANWINKNAPRLGGAGGFSGLGAVVGATYPHELARMRSIMPTSFLLIPGLGAQGGTAADTVPGFTASPGQKKKSGAIVNVSRGLFGKLPPSISNENDLVQELQTRVNKFNADLAAALSGEATR